MIEPGDQEGPTKASATTETTTIDAPPQPALAGAEAPAAEPPAISTNDDPDSDPPAAAGEPGGSKEAGQRDEDASLATPGKPTTTAATAPVFEADHAAEAARPEVPTAAIEPAQPTEEPPPVEAPPSAETEEAARDAEPDRIPAPVHRAQPDKRDTPTTAAQPTKEPPPVTAAPSAETEEPARDAEPDRIPAPVHATEPDKHDTPTTTAEPTEEPPPVTAAPSTETEEPARDAEPDRIPAPVHRAQPHKRDTPTTAAEPTEEPPPVEAPPSAETEEPARDAEPDRIPAPVHRAQPDKRDTPTTASQPAGPVHADANEADAAKPAAAARGAAEPGDRRRPADNLASIHPARMDAPLRPTRPGEANRVARDAKPDRIDLSDDTAEPPATQHSMPPIEPRNFTAAFAPVRPATLAKSDNSDETAAPDPTLEPIVRERTTRVEKPAAPRGAGIPSKTSRPAMPERPGPAAKPGRSRDWDAADEEQYAADRATSVPAFQDDDDEAVETEAGAIADAPKPPASELVHLTIDSLQDYELTGSIPVVVSSVDDKTFIAELPETNISVTGTSVGKAFLELKDEICSIYEKNRGRKFLSPEKRQQLEILSTYIGKSKRNWYIANH